MSTIITSDYIPKGSWRVIRPGQWKSRSSLGDYYWGLPIDASQIGGFSYVGYSTIAAVPLAIAWGVGQIIDLSSDMTIQKEGILKQPAELLYLGEPTPKGLTPFRIDELGASSEIVFQQEGYVMAWNLVTRATALGFQPTPWSGIIPDSVNCVAVGAIRL